MNQAMNTIAYRTVELSFVSRRRIQSQLKGKGSPTLEPRGSYSGLPIIWTTSCDISRKSLGTTNEAMAMKAVMRQACCFLSAFKLLPTGRSTGYRMV